MRRFFQSQINEMPSRVQSQRLKPLLKHVSNVFVKEFKQPNTQRDEQCGFKKFEYRDEP